MDKKTKITLEDVIVTLRKQVLLAKEQHNNEILGALQVTLDTLSDVVSESSATDLATLLEEMACTTRDYWMGIDWKGEIPSISDIHKAVSS